MATLGVPDFDASDIPDLTETEPITALLSSSDQAMVEKLAKLSSAHHAGSRSDNIVSEASEPVTFRKSPSRPPRQVRDVKNVKQAHNVKDVKQVQEATRSLDAGLDAVALDDGLMEDRRTAARKLQERLASDPEFEKRFIAEQAAIDKKAYASYIPDEESENLVDEDDIEPEQTDKMEAMTLALERLGKACILIQNVGVMHVHIHK
jgi:hypothetical protein